MNGTSKSGSKFNTTKSMGKIRYSTYTSTYSTTPSSVATDLSIDYKFRVVGLRLPNPNFLYIEVGIKFMITPNHTTLGHGYSDL